MIPIHFDLLVTWYVYGMLHKMGPKVSGPKSPQSQKVLGPKVLGPKMFEHPCKRSGVNFRQGRTLSAYCFTALWDVQFNIWKPYWTFHNSQKTKGMAAFLKLVFPCQNTPILLHRWQKSRLLLICHITNCTEDISTIASDFHTYMPTRLNNLQGLFLSTSYASFLLSSLEIWLI